MAQIAVRVENGSRKQAVSILKRDQLAAMEMPGQNQVITTLPRGSPNPRIVRAQDSKVTCGQAKSVRTGNRNHARTMRHSSEPIMNPFTAAAHHRLTDSMYADMAVVVSANS